MIEALSEEKQQLYLSALTHYADLADRRAIENEYEALVLRFVKESGAIISKDGDQWCALYGANLQEGIAGFGNTPFMAAANLRDQFHKP